MRPPSSSKALNEDRSSNKKKKKEKKIKSKPSKDRRRRRRDSSLSSYSSDSEDSSRSRRKMPKSKKKRKELKKSERKRSRRKRSRRDSSSDDSSRGCSTGFSDSNRSRSPVRKSKSRKSERGRSHRRKSRYRSPSCSTCSGTRSRSISRSPSPVEERLGSNHRRSPIEERLPSSCDRSPIEERLGSNRGRERLTNDGEQGAIEERLGSGREQGRQSPIKERYKEMGDAKRLRSVLAAPKSFNKDQDKAIETYGDTTSFQRNEIYDENGGLEVGDREKGAYDAQIIEEDDRWQPSKDTEDGGDGYLVCESEPSKDHLVIKENESVGEDECKPDDDLERILRQKALDNLKKFRGEHPANKESLGDKTTETCIHEPYRDEQRCIQKRAPPAESRARSVANTPSKKDNGNTIRGLSNDSGGLRSATSSTTAQNTQNHLKRAQESSSIISSKEASLESRARSVANIPSKKDNGNTMRGLSNDSGDLRSAASSITAQNTPNHLKRAQESSSIISSEDASSVKDNQNKRVPPSGRGKVNGAEVADSSASGAASAASTENKNCTLEEPAAESAGGSQFEEKTFSRMRDGEMVQVNYKVYIPKKTTALARRQLQR